MKLLNLIALHQVTKALHWKALHWTQLEHVCLRSLLHHLHHLFKRTDSHSEDLPICVTSALTLLRGKVKDFALFQLRHVKCLIPPFRRALMTLMLLHGFCDEFPLGLLPTKVMFHIFSHLSGAGFRSVAIPVSRKRVQKALYKWCRLVAAECILFPSCFLSDKKRSA
jgi:hypothetical protein